MSEYAGWVGSEHTPLQTHWLLDELKSRIDRNAGLPSYATVYTELSRPDEPGASAPPWMRVILVFPRFAYPREYRIPAPLSQQCVPVDVCIETVHDPQQAAGYNYLQELQEAHAKIYEVLSGLAIGAELKWTDTAVSDVVPLAHVEPGTYRLRYDNTPSPAFVLLGPDGATVAGPTQPLGPGSEFALRWDGHLYFPSVRVDSSWTLPHTIDIESKVYADVVFPFYCRGRMVKPPVWDDDQNVWIHTVTYETVLRARTKTELERNAS